MPDEAHVNIPADELRRQLGMKPMASRPEGNVPGPEIPKPVKPQREVSVEENPEGTHLPIADLQAQIAQSGGEKE